jgi:predicted ABC-type ATPase
LVFITTNYIGVKSAEIAKERVDLIVSKGGHGIPHSDIERRYTESLDNLYKIIPLCDEIDIYDNTNIFKLIVCIRSGGVIWNDEKLPDWIKTII